MSITAAKYFSSVWAVGHPAKEALLASAAILLKGGKPGQANIMAAKRASMPKSHESPFGEKIFKLPIMGTLTKHDQECGPIGMLSMGEMLREADASGQYSEIVLEIDCGGGEADGTGLLAAIIANLTTPTRAVISGLCCSAAYWLASACKSIEATANTDMIGCIGTMLTFQDMRGKLEKEGIIISEILATASPDKNSEFRDAENGDFTAIRKMLDVFNAEFVGFIGTSRPKVAAAALTGFTYMAQEALALGLIDRITSITNTAKPTAMALKKEKMKPYNRINAIIGFAALGIFASMPEGPPALDLLENRLAGFHDLEASVESDKKAKAEIETQKAALDVENAKLTARIAALEAELEAQPAATASAPVIVKKAGSNTAEWDAALDVIADMEHSKSLAGNPMFN